jgi:hypothetical protein
MRVPGRIGRKARLAQRAYCRRRLLAKTAIAARLKKSSIVSNLIQTRTRDRPRVTHSEALPVISPRPKSALG